MHLAILHALGRCVVLTPVATITPRARLGFALAVRLIGERGGRVMRGDLLRMLWPREEASRASHALSEALRKLRVKGLDIRYDGACVWIPRQSAIIDADRECDDWRSFIGRDVTILPGYAATHSPAFRDWLDDWRSATAQSVAHRLTAADALGTIPCDSRTTSALAGAMLRLERTPLADREIPYDAAPSTPPPALARVAEAAAGDMQAIIRALDAASLGHGRITASIPIADAVALDPRTLVNASRERGFALARVECAPGCASRPIATVVELVRTLRALRGAAGATPAMSRYLDATMLSYSGAVRTPNPAPIDLGELRLAIADLIDAVLHEQPLVIVIERASAIDSASRTILRELDGWATTRMLVVVLALAPSGARPSDAATDSPRDGDAALRRCAQATDGSCT